MAKIYNEIVIDMNPESPTFEEAIYEDSFDYEGDMILCEHGGVMPAEGTSYWVLYQDGYLDENNVHVQPKYKQFTWQNNAWSSSPGDAKPANELEGQQLLNPEQLPHFDYEQQGGGGGGREKDIRTLTTDYDPSISESNLGMPDVTADEMLGKSEGEMLQWIIDTRYGGQLPSNVTSNDILTQIRTKLPQKGGMETTDWYGIQGTAGKVGSTARSVYGGMGAGARQEIAGQKQIGKDIYALEEGKGKDWTSKFRTFLSSLPTATGT